MNTRKPAAIIMALIALMIQAEIATAKSLPPPIPKKCRPVWSIACKRY